MKLYDNAGRRRRPWEAALKMMKNGPIDLHASTADSLRERGLVIEVSPGEFGLTRKGRKLVDGGA
jgi:predicted transcriptional regulator